MDISETANLINKKKFVCNSNHNLFEDNTDCKLPPYKLEMPLHSVLFVVRRLSLIVGLAKRAKSTRAISSEVLILEHRIINISKFQQRLEKCQSFLKHQFSRFKSP